MKKSTPSIFWRWAPGILISVAAIIVLVSLVGIQDSFSIIFSTPIPYIILVGLFSLMFLLVRSFGWKILLGKKASYKETFLKISEGYFINNIFPFRLGEISRALFMGHAMQVHPMEILSTIVVERVFDLIILAVLILNMLPYALGLSLDAAYFWVLMIIVLLGLGVLFVLVQNESWVLKKMDQIGKRFPFLNKFVFPYLKYFLSGFKILKNPIQFIGGFLGVAGSWLVSLVQYSLFLWLMFPEADWWWGAFSNVAMALGIALPSAPGGVGIFEGTIIAALKVFNIPESLSLAYALVLHIVHYIITAAIGLFALYRDGVSLKGLFSKLIRQNESLR